MNMLHNLAIVAFVWLVMDDFERFPVRWVVAWLQMRNWILLMGSCVGNTLDRWLVWDLLRMVCNVTPTVA